MKSTDDKGLIPVVVASEANSTYIRTIPTAQPTVGDGSVSLDLGLPPECATSVAAGGKRPEMKDMNGIWNLFSRAIQSLQAYRGVYDASFATAIGGYPKNAMVSDSSGNFWVSTSDANTTVPGSAGAKWKSLFDGYGTQAWANGQFLQLATTATQTVTGPVTFASSVGNFVFQSDGNCVFYDKNGNPMFSVGSSKMLLNSNMEAHFNGLTYVPSVTDWTTKQVVPASDADARYAHDGAPFTIGNTTESGISNVIKYGTQSRLQLQNDDNAVFYDNLGPLCNFRRNGSTFSSPITVPDVTDFTSKNTLNAKTAEGRYATQAALTSEATARANADTTLQTNLTNEATTRASADTALSTAITNEVTRATGVEALKANLAGGNSFSGTQSVAGDISVGSGHVVSITGSSGSGSMYSWPEYYTSGNLSGINAVTHVLNSSGASLSWMALRGADGSVWTSGGGKLAYTSQLPTAGTITNGTYTKVPLNDGSGKSVLTQNFEATVPNGGGTVSFPMAYTSAPTPPLLTPHSGGATLEYHTLNTTNTTFDISDDATGVVGTITYSISVMGIA